MNTGSCNLHHTGSMGLRFVLGVDGGGSGTRARVWSVDGALLGTGVAGPSGLSLGVVSAWRAVDAAAQAAFSEAGQAVQRGTTALSLGLAGANVAELAAEFEAAGAGWGRLLLASDGDTALRGAHRGAAGVMVAAGTGSVGEALRADGRRASVGGWGFPAGDEGGGAWLGLRAVGCAQRALDGRERLGALAHAVLGRIGATPEAVLAWCARADQSAYATLAPLVFDAAERDPIADALVAEAASAIEAHVSALDPSRALPVVVTGSVGRRLRSCLSAPVIRRLVEPAGDAVDGARDAMLELLHADAAPRSTLA